MRPAIAGHDRRASSYSPRPYPGDIPPWSYCIQDGQVRPLTPTDGDYSLDDGQTLAAWLAAQRGTHVPLVAYGSNACPGRLVEKFPRHHGHGFALLQGTLHGAVRVWSANPSRAGAVPLTIAAAPRGHDQAHLLLIPAADVAALDRSEGRGGPFYHLARLESCHLTLTDGTTWARPLAYVGHAERGPMIRHGQPVTYAQADQAQALRLIGDASPNATADSHLPEMSVINPAIPLAEAVSSNERPLHKWVCPGRS